MEAPPARTEKPVSTSSTQNKPLPLPQQEVVITEGVDVEAESSRRNSRQKFYAETEPTIDPTLAARPKIYELLQEARNPYAELLKNPKSFRDAVVVSEILKPKHF